jgi:hypothetical protein
LPIISTQALIATQARSGMNVSTIAFGLLCYRDVLDMTPRHCTKNLNAEVFHRLVVRWGNVETSIGMVFSLLPFVSYG